jgi:hypothetical protein
LTPLPLSMTRRTRHPKTWDCPNPGLSHHSHCSHSSVLTNITTLTTTTTTTTAATYTTTSSHLAQVRPPPPPVQPLRGVNVWVAGEQSLGHCVFVEVSCWGRTGLLLRTHAGKERTIVQARRGKGTERAHLSLVTCPSHSHSHSHSHTFPSWDQTTYTQPLRMRDHPIPSRSRFHTTTP